LFLLDYSQYSSFLMCPWKWYESYVQGMSPRYSGQRSDPLCLGSLVHNGLDNYSKSGRPEIDMTCLTDNNPTPETYRIAQMMCEGYVQKYPRERWEVESTEEAVQFPYAWCKTCNHQAVCDEGEHCLGCGSDTIPVAGIAKLDGQFYVPEDTTIESGLPGQTLTLSRGWWSREYKTKSPGIDRSVWLAEWASKRQADFQILALQHRLEETPRHSGDDISVQGVLVSVLEKPRQYTPKRKCKGCGETWELDSFRPTATGHACPMCGAEQKIKPYVPTVVPTPEFFRIVVTRSPQQLETSRREFAMVAEAMEQMRVLGKEIAIPNRDNCISNRYHKKCEYAEQHIGGLPVAEPQFVKVDPFKYLGI